MKLILGNREHGNFGEKNREQGRLFLENMDLVGRPL